VAFILKGVVIAVKVSLNQSRFSVVVQFESQTAPLPKNRSSRKLIVIMLRSFTFPATHHFREVWMGCFRH
jgi:hypothetical protein